MANDKILWIDLETTGNGPDDEIIEVGAVLTDLSLNELAHYQRVYRTTRSISDIDPVVQKMHFENGLWAETHKKTASYASDEYNHNHIVGWVGSNHGFEGGPLPLAGSGVSHFDRRYIRQTWPRLDKKLTYWHYDIGVMRRFYRLFGAEEYIPNNDIKGHRALDDIRQHIQEAREYRDLIAPGVPAPYVL